MYTAVYTNSTFKCFNITFLIPYIIIHPIYLIGVEIMYLEKR